MPTFRITNGVLTGVMMSDNYPDNTLPQPPLGIWGPTDPRPTHPIAGYPWPTPPQPPLGIWGPTDPRPTHPIAGYPWPMPPQPPLGIWGGGNVPYPTPPIYFPPEGGAQPPLGTWGPNDPRPTQPIVIPPNLPPTLPDPDNRPIEWKTGWTEATGWVVVGIPQVPVPTPAAAG